MERFGCRTHFAHLRQVQRIADTVSDIRRKRPDVRPGIGKPREFFHPALHAYIGILSLCGSTRYSKIQNVYIFPAVAAPWVAPAVSTPATCRERLASFIPAIVELCFGTLEKRPGFVRHK